MSTTHSQPKTTRHLTALFVSLAFSTGTLANPIIIGDVNLLFEPFQIGNIGFGSVEIAGETVAGPNGLAIGVTSTGDGSLRASGTQISIGGGFGGGLRVGDGGKGFFRLSNSGVLNSDFTFIGRQSGSDGEMVVSGAGTQWTETGQIQIGSSGKGKLTIEDDATVSGVVGINGGNGILEIKSGGTLASTTTQFLGITATSTAEVVIDGAGSRWDVSGAGVGLGGASSRVQVSDGGVFDVSDGLGTSANTTIEVTDSGSLIAADVLTIKNTLEVTRGGDVDTRFGLIAGALGTEAEVRGPGSKWTSQAMQIGTDTEHGTLALRIGGELASGITTVGDKGRITGNGTITGNLVNDGGFIAPGLSPGRIELNGNFEQRDGVLALEIGGSAPGQFDVFDINGSATFSGGVIEISFIDSFIPQLGDFFDILLADSVSGIENVTTSIVGGPAGLTVDLQSLASGQGLRLAVNSSRTPEPAALLLMLTGLLSVWGIRRLA